MAGKVKLEVVEGAMRGKSFEFDEHDTFIFGRLKECQACLPNDQQVSRHHFLMEANPPDARIRDLGSLNGTYVNDMKCGAREKGESPEQGAMRKYPEVALKNGDKIRVGQTVLSVHLQAMALCCECNCAIPDGDREKCAWLGGTYICAKCKAKLISMNKADKAPEPVRCQKCGKDVSAEIGHGQRGDYVCNSCRKKADLDPINMLKILLNGAARAKGVAEAPDIAGYDIEKRIGIGGFGAVYLARSRKSSEKVALKVMLSKVAVDAKSREKFLREIDLMKGLQHANIVPLIDNGATGIAFYFAMEYCESGSLADLMTQRGNKISMSEAAPLMLQALEGMAYAHSRDLVHRDIKPHNILLKGSGKNCIAKVSDFGLAKNFQKAGFSGQTFTGEYAGTPVFMPREQIVSFKYVKPVTDVWSLGATFYAILTGQVPRDIPEGKDPIDVILHGNIIPIRKRDSGIPKGVAEVIDRALSDNITERYQNAGEMRKALEKVL